MIDRLTLLKSRIVIVLATFNGAEYLEAQLDSLLSQSVTNWTLLIRDDGSTDATIDIITRYTTQDKRIRLVNNHTSTGSVLGNFSVLLERAHAEKADYIFCCDQDDLWQPEKLKRVLLRLKQLEGPEREPCLVHHDLTVVDAGLKLISESFFKMMDIEPGNEQNPQRFLCRNEVTGCAMAFNYSLLTAALPIAPEAAMHDWWLALCAAYYGKIAVINEKLVLYRQHDKNIIGAKSYWGNFALVTKWFSIWKVGNQEFYSTISQSQAFHSAMDSKLDFRQKPVAAIEQYSHILSLKPIQRIRLIRDFGLWRPHIVLNLVLVLRLLLLPEYKSYDSNRR